MSNGTTRAMRPIEITERTTAAFWSCVSKPDGEDGCWEWTGARTPAGYGQVPARYFAHRYSYALLVGPIPVGLVIDHLCRVPCCVNPAHLESVSQRVNTLRGTAPNAVTARTGICRRGHSMSNAIVRKNGTRQCRECHYERHRRWQKSAAGVAWRQKPPVATALQLAPDVGWPDVQLPAELTVTDAPLTE